jgi:hypothetical protein
MFSQHVVSTLLRLTTLAQLLGTSEFRLFRLPIRTMLLLLQFMRLWF